MGSLYTRLALGISLRGRRGRHPGVPAHHVRRHGVSSQGYCFQVELAWRAIRAGFVVVEVPITFVEREIGESKVSGDIVRETLVSVSRWEAQHRWNQWG